MLNFITLTFIIFQPIQAEELGILNSSLYIDISDKGIGEMGILYMRFFMRQTQSR
jgi:hypothetical protein